MAAGVHSGDLNRARSRTSRSSPRRRMPTGGPLRGALALVVLLFVAAGTGRVIGVGPLAGTVPADQVTDPGEMIARSLQATLDAASVHVDGTLEGTLPGALLERDEASVDLAGTTITADLRPRDARTQAHVTSAALGVDLDTITVWTDAWSRSRGGSWQKAPVGRGDLRHRGGRQPAHARGPPAFVPCQQRPDADARQTSPARARPGDATRSGWTRGPIPPACSRRCCRAPSTARCPRSPRWSPCRRTPLTLRPAIARRGGGLAGRDDRPAARARLRGLGWSGPDRRASGGRTAVGEPRVSCPT